MFVHCSAWKIFIVLEEWNRQNNPIRNKICTMGGPSLVEGSSNQDKLSQGVTNNLYQASSKMLTPRFLGFLSVVDVSRDSQSALEVEQRLLWLENP